MYLRGYLDSKFAYFGAHLRLKDQRGEKSQPDLSHLMAMLLGDLSHTTCQIFHLPALTLNLMQVQIQPQ